MSEIKYQSVQTPYFKHAEIWPFYYISLSIRYYAKSFKKMSSFESQNYCFNSSMAVRYHTADFERKTSNVI